jgi:hypothetical protein
LFPGAVRGTTDTVNVSWGGGTGVGAAGAESPLQLTRVPIPRAMNEGSTSSLSTMFLLSFLLFEGGRSRNGKRHAGPRRLRE